MTSDQAREAPEAAPDPTSGARAAAAPSGSLLATVDRGAVLLLGVAVGGVIAFQVLADRTQAPVAAPHPAQTGSDAFRPADFAIPYPPHLLEVIARRGVVTVGVFGDSFGDGLWAALSKGLPRGYQVLRFSKPSTGFTHTSDLSDVLEAQLGRQPVDIAVVCFGANDAQGLYDDEGRPWPLLSEPWKAIYAARMAHYIGRLRAHGVMVYFVGLPRMRSPAYDAHIVSMEEFYGDVMRRLGVPYIPVRALTIDAEGGYSDHLAGADGEPQVMRASDGIHMTMAGYERISAPIRRRLDAYVAAAQVSLALQRAPGRPEIVGAASAGAGDAEGEL